MERAINAYYTITASPELREAERLREKARRELMKPVYLHLTKTTGGPA